MLLEKGRECVIVKGSDAGKKAVIVDVIDENFVKIVGEKVKERRINIKHIELLSSKAKEIPKPREKTKKSKEEKKEKK